jgi:predicted NUDIX family phosphoesterase
VEGGFVPGNLAERILVVPRSELFAAGHVQGFSQDGDTVRRFLQTVGARGQFVPRGPAEQDQGLKQIVPYGVVRHGNLFFLFRRGSRGNETGLRGRWSIGLGGHVNPEDWHEIGPELLKHSLLRELAEEVIVDRPQPQLWGVLNDDEDPVGRRHFGFVYRVGVASPEARSRELGKIRGVFVPMEAVQARRAEMETWSQMLVEPLVHLGVGS